MVEVVSELDTKKEIQLKLHEQMTDMNDRLMAVEEELAAPVNCAEENIRRAVNQAVGKETAIIQSGLDEFEDLSGRNNLVL